MNLELDRDRNYTPEEVLEYVQDDQGSLVVSESVETALSESRTALNELLDQGTSVYGVNTGFGDLVDRSSAEDSTVQGKRLIYHLAAGTGEPLDPRIVRTALVLRAVTLSRGYSGIRPETFRSYRELVDSGFVPAVPEVGSLGASGDLIPMANAILALMGEGQRYRPDEGETEPAGRFFSENDLAPLTPDAREGLALVNGVPVCTAVGCVALSSTKALLRVAEDFSAWLYASMGCSREALEDVLNRVKGHPEQHETAERIRRKLGERTIRDSDRPLQEVYSIRSVPQVLGAVRKAYQQARETLVEEINGVDDNPIVFREDGNPRVQHGANFVGQSLALTYDHLNNALTQLGNLFERQLSVLVDSDRNGGYEPMLADEAGPNSGLAGAQLNATAVLSSMRNDAQSYASGSLTTNGGNQDVVPMTMEAGRNLLEQTRRASKILAIQGVALNQYDHLSQPGEGSAHPSNAPDWFPGVRPMESDRPLKEEIRTLADRILEVN